MGQPSQLCTGVCEEKSQLEGSLRSEENLSAEAGESRMLEAVIRERMVKTEHAEKDLVCAVVICKM
jgi:hypothetical protein